jgi:hypothetical protein
MAKTLIHRFKRCPLASADEIVNDEPNENGNPGPEELSVSLPILS